MSFVFIRGMKDWLVLRTKDDDRFFCFVGEYITKKLSKTKDYLIRSFSSNV